MTLITWLNKSSSPHGLAIFRILFAVIMLWDLKRIHDIQLIDSFYDHGIIFPYEFLNLPLPSAGAMDGIMLLITVSAILVLFGIAYRIAMTVFALGFSYFFFLDQTLYNNHLYLICLLSFIMIFVPADAAFSLNKKRHKSTVPQWSYRLLQVMILIVFFFGGISKMNPYWIEGSIVEPASAACAARMGISFVDSVFMNGVFVWGGLLFDLFIGAFLLMPKTRKWAIISVVLFNVSNSILFNDIFIFPFFMIAAMVLFMDQQKVLAWLERRAWYKKKKEVKSEGVPLGKLGLVFMVVFLLIQLFLPIRHYLKPGYTDWTGEGQRFAWRMKIQHRSINEVQFAIFDKARMQIHDIKVQDYLFPDEITQMCNSPQMILQFAHYLKDVVAVKNGIADCWIKCKVNVSFNGLPSALIFDPSVDLIEASENNVSVSEWINPIPTADSDPVIVTNTTISVDVMTNGL